MKSLEQKVVEYIQKCASKGVSSISDIYEYLGKEISCIKHKLTEVDPLRIELSELQKIEQHLAVMLQTDKIQSEFDDDSDEMEGIRSTVIKIIDAQHPCSNTDIKLKFMEQDKDAYNSDSKIYRAIKWLAERGAIEKNDSKQIVPGPKWGEFKEL